MSQSDDPKPITKTEIEEGWKLVDQKIQADIDKFLDAINLERLEWERLQNDLYPGIATDQEED